jgi:hypothetical protein
MPRSGQNRGVVPLAWGFVNQLDSGLRRNDVIFLMDYLGLTQIIIRRFIMKNSLKTK